MQRLLDCIIDLERTCLPRIPKTRLNRRSRNLRRSQRDALARIGLSTAAAPMSGELTTCIAYMCPWAHACDTATMRPAVVPERRCIRKFPDEIENLVVLKASVYGKFYQIGLANTEEDLEVAASHTNHMSALNQEYTMCLQNYLSGYQLNAKEQGVVNDS